MGSANRPIGLAPETHLASSDEGEERTECQMLCENCEIQNCQQSQPGHSGTHTCDWCHTQEASSSDEAPWNASAYRPESPMNCPPQQATRGTASTAPRPPRHPPPPPPSAPALDHSVAFEILFNGCEEENLESLYRALSRFYFERPGGVETFETLRAAFEGARARKRAALRKRPRESETEEQALLQHPLGMRGFEGEGPGLMEVQMTLVWL